MTNSLSKILITGANGQLAQAICHHAQAKQFNIILLKKNELDICDAQQVAQALAKYQPDLVINTAAYTAVDKAESESLLAHRINATGTEVLAKACDQVNTRLIHLSTDYVFDGTSETSYSETDHTNPINEYGKSKLLGEQACLDNCKNSAVLRVSGVFSEYGHNFVKTMLKLGQTKTTLNIVSDQYTCPTYAGDIASTLFRLAQEPTVNGIYHFCSDQRVSWFDFATMIFDQASKLGYPLTIQQIEPCSSKDYVTAAKRPPNSVLSCEKIKAALNIEIPQLELSLHKTLEHLKEDHHE